MSDALEVAVGWSAKVNALSAGTEAAESALSRLPSRTPHLALVFGSSWLDQIPLLDGVHSVIGAIPLAGESTAGEITSEGPRSHSCVVALFYSDTPFCSVGLGEAIDRNPREAGQQAGYAAIRGFRGNRRAGLLLFGDGLATSFADVVRGLQEALGTSSLIAGGMAGDDLRFSRTYQYAGDRVVSQSVVGVLIGGAVKIGVGIEHGFAPISKPRRITRAKANILYELDDQPAASVYEEYFGTELVQRMQQEGLTRQAIAYPLGIQREVSEQWLLRNVVSFGEDGSLLCSGELPETGWLQLMIGSREAALDAAYRAAQQATRPLNRIACTLVFDSALRRKLLGPRHAEMEIARIKDVIGAATPLVGCYTYGEQAPFGTTTYERSTVQTGSVLVIALGL